MHANYGASHNVSETGDHGYPSSCFIPYTSPCALARACICVRIILLRSNGNYTLQQPVLVAKGKARGSARLLDEALEGAEARVAQQALQVLDPAETC